MHDCVFQWFGVCSSNSFVVNDILLAHTTLSQACAHTHTHTDFVLAFQITVEKKQGGFLGFCKKNKEDTEASQDKRNKKRETFIENCKKLDLEFELQDCAVSVITCTFSITLC